MRTPRSLQLESSTVLAASGMTDFLQIRLGMRSKLTLQWPIASKSKCRGGGSADSGYAKADVAKHADEDLARAAIDVCAILAASTSLDRGIVATLTEANSRLRKQLEDSSQTLK
jgi:hypothetical protein